MKLKKAKIFLIISAFLVGCAILPEVDKQDKEKLLCEHLQSWETIRIDGIIEANYKSFAFRKNITIRKNRDILKIDIYDTGLFGMRPTPFISAFLDSVLVLEMPDQPESVVIYSKDLPDISTFLHPVTLYEHKDQIIKDYKIHTGNVEFTFSEKMQMIKIEDKDAKFKIEFEYQDELVEIIFYMKDEEIANIQIDKITYKKL